MTSNMQIGLIPTFALPLLIPVHCFSLQRSCFHFSDICIPIGPFVSSTDCFITVWLQSWWVAIPLSAALFFCAFMVMRNGCCIKMVKELKYFTKMKFSPFLTHIESETTLTLERGAHIYKLYLVSILDYSSTQKIWVTQNKRYLNYRDVNPEQILAMDCTTESYLMWCIHVHAVFTWHQLGHQQAWHQRSLLDAGYQHTSSFAHDCAHLFPPKERDVKSFAGINKILICKTLTSWHYHDLYCMAHVAMQKRSGNYHVQ